MNKSARKKRRDQGTNAQGQRTLHLAAVLERNLYQFVVREGMKALDEVLEQD